MKPNLILMRNLKCLSCPTLGKKELINPVVPKKKHSGLKHVHCMYRFSQHSHSASVLTPSALKMMFCLD